MVTGGESYEILVYQLGPAAKVPTIKLQKYEILEDALGA